MLGGGRVRVGASERDPRRAPVPRPHQLDIVGTVHRPLAKPVRDQRAVGRRRGGREVRPVRQDLRARGDHRRLAPPPLAEPGEPDGVAVADRLLPDEEEVVAIRRERGGDRRRGCRQGERRRRGRRRRGRLDGVGRAREERHGSDRRDLGSGEHLAVDSHTAEDVSTVRRYLSRAQAPCRARTR